MDVLDRYAAINRMNWTLRAANSIVSGIISFVHTPA
jgi:hypothetical protein